MGRHFSESEVSAMSRNRIEDKGLKQRLFRLHEEKTMTYDNYAKERKLVMDNLKENRRTSGNIEIDFEDTEIPEETFKNVLLSRRPWSCTPSETTFNVIYRDASDPGLLKATYHLKDKGKRTISRRASARSVPNGSRSLAVSRQSTRSEPPIEKGRTESPSRVLNKSRLSLTSQISRISTKCKNVRPDGPDIKICIPKESRKSALITAAWTKESSMQLEYRYIHYAHKSNSDNLKEGNKVEKISIEENVLKSNPENEDLADVKVTSSEHINLTTNKLPTKNKTKKRLSIQEPNLSKVIESDTDSVKIYDLTSNENGNINNSIPESSFLRNDLENSIAIQQTEKLDEIVEKQQKTETALHDNGDETQKQDQAEINQNFTIERQCSRPSTVAFEFLDFKTDLQDGINDKNCTYYRGKPIHNYVKPQLRYKYDPFATKSRERLVRKLTTDVPIFIKEEKRDLAKRHRVYSKGTRKRMLQQLIEENNSQKKGFCFNSEQGKLEDKIEDFYASISKFCEQNTNS